jgi:hypothetical protein
VIAVRIQVGEELREFENSQPGELGSRQPSVRVRVETREIDGLLREHVSGRECKRKHKQKTTQVCCVHNPPPFLVVVWAMTRTTHAANQKKESWFPRLTAVP